jgi:hypothetical protein
MAAPPFPVYLSRVAVNERPLNPPGRPAGDAPPGAHAPAWTWRRIAVWAALALAAVGWCGPAFVQGLRPAGHIMDFGQEWLSARNLLNGQPVYQEQLPAWERTTGQHPDPTAMLEWNAHPPTAVLLALPFAWMDYPDAQLAWNVVSLGALAGSLYLVWRGLGAPFTVWMLLPTVALLLVCNPLTVQLLQGQLNLILLLLIVAAWASDRSGRPWWAGAFLGVAAAVKLFPGFLFLYFLLRRRWRSVAAGAVCFAVVTGATAALEGQLSYMTYVTEVLPGLEKYRADWLNCSLTGFWFRLFNPDASRKVTPLWQAPALASAGALVSSALVVACLAPVVWRARGRDGGDRAFALSVTAMLLISPITWNHYLLLLLPPAAWLWLRLPRGPARAALAPVLVLFWVPADWLFASVMGRYVLDYQARMAGPAAAPWQVLTGISAQFYALLGLFVLGLVEAKWPGARPPASPVSAGGAAPAGAARGEAAKPA